MDVTDSGTLLKILLPNLSGHLMRMSFHSSDHPSSEYPRWGHFKYHKKVVTFFTLPLFLVPLKQFDLQNTQYTPE